MNKIVGMHLAFKAIFVELRFVKCIQNWVDVVSNFAQEVIVYE